MVDEPYVYDPCALVTKLQEAREKLLTGEQAEEVEYATETGQRRRVRYNMNRMRDLEIALRQAQMDCAKVNGVPWRFAVRAGSRSS